MSISESDARPVDRLDFVVAAIVGLAALAVYRLTIDASLAGLYPPDALTPRAIDEARLVEYLNRTMGVHVRIGSAAVAAAATLVTYLNARMMHAPRAAAAAASLAMAFGREFWSQALLPGYQHVFGLSAAAAIACALQWRRRQRHVWLVAGVLAVLLASAPAQFHADGTIVDLCRWMFLELNAMAIAFAAFGAAVLMRDRRASPGLGILAVLAVTTPLRAAPSLHAALIPVSVAVAPLVATGAARLFAWLASPPIATAALVLLPLVPLAGNVRHTANDTDAVVRPYLERAGDRQSGCGIVIGHSDLTRPPDDRGLSTPGSARCQALAFPAARNALEHLGYRFELVPVPSRAAGAQMTRPLPEAFDPAQVQLSRVVGRDACTPIRSSAWTDVTTLASQGRIGIRLGSVPSDGVTLYAGRDRPLDPWRVISWAVVAPKVTASVAAPSDAGVPDAVRAAAFIERIDVTGGAGDGSLTSVDFSGIPSVLLARSSVDDPLAAICPAPRGTGLFADAAIHREVVSGRRSTFGDGWGPIDRTGGVTSQELRQPQGELLIGLARTLALDVVLHATAANVTGTIALRVNDHALGAHPLIASGAYRWSVPADVWKPGVNQLFVVSVPGIMVGEIELRYAR